MKELLEKIDYDAIIEKLCENPMQWQYKFYEPNIGTITAHMSCITDSENTYGSGLKWVIEAATMASVRLGRVGNMCKEAREYIEEKINKLYWGE